jgi:hypothetical protein
VDRVREVELLGQLHQVVGVGVHVIAGPGLTGAAVAAAVVRDAAESPRREEEHLRIPVVRAERPAVTEDHRLSAAPVLVIDLRPVFGGDGAHRLTSFPWG